MMDEIMRFATQYGIFAALFVWLLIYVMKENKKRETSLQDTLKTVTEKIADKLEKVCGDVTQIKDDVQDLKDRR